MKAETSRLILREFTAILVLSMERVMTCASVFQDLLLLWNLPQMFVLRMEPCAMIKVSVVLSVINKMGRNGNFRLFQRNSWPPHAEN